MLQKTWEYIHLFQSVFSFSSDKYTEVTLLDHMVVLCLIFLRTLHNPSSTNFWIKPCLNSDLPLTHQQSINYIFGWVFFSVLYKWGHKVYKPKNMTNEEHSWTHSQILFLNIITITFLIIQKRNIIKGSDETSEIFSTFNWPKSIYWITKWEQYLLTTHFVQNNKWKLFSLWGNRGLD